MALLDAGFELFGTRGIAPTTIEEICIRAGLNKRYFYESFTSIRQLADAVVARILEDIWTGLAPLVSSGGIRDPYPAVSYFVGAVMSDPRIARLLFIEAESGDMTHQRRGFVDLAVRGWVSRDPAMPEDSDELALARLGAYAYAGACREVMLAVIAGDFDLTPDEVSDFLVTTLGRMRQAPP